MKLIAKITLVLIALFLAFGCSQQIRPIPTYSHPAERIFKKNYVLNERLFANVGDPVIVFKDYYAFKRTLNKLRASNDFRVTVNKWSISGKKGELFPAEGTVIDEGQLYYLLPLKASSHEMYYSLLINQDGYFSKKSALRLPIERDKVLPRAFGWISISPPDTKFSLVEEEVIDTTMAGFTNFEIIYTGKNDHSLTFQYREYTPQDVIRPAYSQNLTYNANAQFIRFKKIKISRNPF